LYLPSPEILIRLQKDMLGKLFGWFSKKETAAPDIRFGRYSDNNKSVAKIARWSEAEKLFKENKRLESLDAFFDYLKDEEEDNVMHVRNGPEGTFELYQGSKVVRGEYNNERLKAEVTLARMPRPSTPVMRRLLEMNFNLFYSRFAMEADRLNMRFDSDINTATPNKLYYGLKELATKADKQDDLLVQNFSSLEKADIEHVEPVPEEEKSIKFEALQKWIQETLEQVKTLDADKFSGGIAYLLLALVYKIDYLIVPEGPIMNELEAIPDIYFKKDNRPTAEKNSEMIEALEKLKGKSSEQVYPFLFRSKHTFAIVTPQNYKTIVEAIKGSHQNMIWYRDNGFPAVANQIIEYGFSYCQYSYSLPRPLSELFRLFMQINYGEYFGKLGFAEEFYDQEKKEFDKDEIVDEINNIIEFWRLKYPRLDFDTEALKFESKLNFNYSFTRELTNLKFE
jgi:hypothetical protein